jgi:RNA-splicing ligase RtcB
MTENPQDRPSDKPPLADTIRAKMEEYEVDRHLNDLATTLEGAVRHGVAKAGELAHEHKGDIERLLDKAAGAVDRRTDGKHAERINQVRGSLERGVEKIADQRTSATPDEPDADVPPSNG